MVSKPLSAQIRDASVKRRGKMILGPITLDLAASGFTIVLGPNGAGKTTFLKVLHGIERLSGGSIQWSAPEDDVRDAQAYVFQTPVMLHRSVAQNLAYPLQLRSIPKAEIAERVTTWAARIGLSDHVDRPARRLSGGEKQKLALARALIREPKVLFLDEPCANLDSGAMRDIEALLQETNATGTRIIMTTHNMGQARRLASDVVFLLNGKLHEQSTADEFFTASKTSEAKAFLEGDIV